MNPDGDFIIPVLDSIPQTPTIAGDSIVRVMDLFTQNKTIQVHVCDRVVLEVQHSQMLSSPLTFWARIVHLRPQEISTVFIFLVLLHDASTGYESERERYSG
jgi:hypothetical protein